MTTPNFYRAVTDVVQHAREQGLVPAITINHHACKPTSGIDARSLAQDPSSFGPLGRWMAASVFVVTAGVALHFNQKSVPGPNGAAAVRPASALELSQTTVAPTTKAPAIVKLNDTRLVPVRFQGKMIHSVHPEDRISLAKHAADAGNLDRVLGKESWRVVYALIAAESNWMPRSGMGRNKKASYGIAQMEAATATALGIDPHDPRNAAVGVVNLIKEGVRAYQERRRQGLKIVDDYGEPLRTNDALSVYISVHYNTSTRFRNEWDGSTSTLLTPTKHHIKNVRYGLGEAALIEKQVKAQKAYDDILRQAGTPVLEDDAESIKL